MQAMRWDFPHAHGLAFLLSPSPIDSFNHDANLRDHAEYHRE